MGMSQFEVPKTKKYKLEEVEMDSNVVTTPTVQNDEPIKPQPKYLLESDIKPILDELSQCKEELKNLKAQINKTDTDPNLKPTKVNPNTKEK